MAGSLAARMRRFAVVVPPLAAALLAAASMLPSRCEAESAASAANQAANASAVQPAPLTRLGERQAAAVERHIVTLHSELRITPDEEPLWQPLASAMRNSVLQLDGVYAGRQRQRASMSAVDDLRSYGMVQQTNARNVQTLIEPFRRLYDSFSPSQKRQADAVVRRFTDNAVKGTR